jgi:NADPH:quinone reductase-like Zn-dependent oxidoreductase
MKAVVLTDFDTPATVQEGLPAPEPAEGELLVRVLASSANPVDNAIVAGMLKDMAEYEFPVVLGRDYAGVVEDHRPPALPVSRPATASSGTSPISTRPSTAAAGPS